MVACELEQVVVCVKLPLFSLFLSCIYIRPNSHPDVYASHANCVQQILDEAQEQDVVVALGDYNLPRLDWIYDADACCYIPVNATSEVETVLTEAMLSSGIQQINNIANSNGRILDLAFVSEPTLFELLVPPSALLRIDRHHTPIVLKLDYHAQPTNSRDGDADAGLDFRRCDMHRLNEHLSAVDWSCVTEASSLDAAVTELYTHFNNVAHAVVPKKRPRLPSDSDKPPWWIPELNNKRNQLRKKRAKYNRCRSSDSANALIAAEHEFSTLQNECFFRYITRVQNDLRREPTRFWSFVKERRKTGRIPNEVTYGNTKSSSDETSAELFATFFENAHSAETPTICEQSLNNVQTYNMNVPQFTVTPADVKKALSSVNTRKGAGPDEIPPSVLKNCSRALARPIATIFNRSIAESKFPTEWKIASVTPIHKAGSLNNVENYRPISILSCLAKVFEKMVYTYVYPTVQNVISEKQHGFVKKRSTTTNLMVYTTSIIDKLEKRQQVDGVYVDFAKAFDRVPHNLTVAKLSRIGLPDWLTRWLGSYLKQRTAYVKVGTARSPLYAISSGVPQGSHLGPLIFVLFINDLTTLLKSDNLFYADDLKLYRSILDPSDCDILQTDINTLLWWCARNGMKVNQKKCKVITFHRTRSPTLNEYVMENVALERVQSIKDLGVVLDRKLNFNDHVSATVAKSHAMLGFLRRNAAWFDDIHTLKALYCSLVRSVLEYAAPIWAPYFAVHQQSIERVQRRFTRFAARVLPWSDPSVMVPYENLCALFQLPTLNSRRTLLQRLFIFDVLQNNIDCSFLLENVRLHAPARRLRDVQLLWIAGHRTTYGYNNPLDACCRKFNNPSVLNVFDFNVSKFSFKRNISCID